MGQEFILIYLPPLAVLALLAIFINLNASIEESIKKTFKIVVCLTSVDIIAHLLEGMLVGVPGGMHLRIFLTALGVLLRSIILYFIVCIEIKDSPLAGLKKLLGVFVVIIFLCNMTAFFTNWMFVLNPATDFFLTGPLYHVYYIVIGIYFILIQVCSVKKAHEKERMEALLLTSISLLVIVSVAMEVKMQIRGMGKIINGISLVFYFMYLQVRSIKKNSLDSQRDAKAKQNQYLKAITSGAIGIYEINLTTDTLMRALQVEGKLHFPMASAVGLETPCNYTEYITRWTQRMREKDKERFLKYMSRESLITSFENNEFEMTAEYPNTGFDGKRVHVRKTTFLTQDEETADIYALMVIKDITMHKEEEEEHIRNLNIVKALSDDYTSIFYIDAQSEQFKTCRVVDETRRKIGYMLHGGRFYHEALEAFVKNYVHPEDQEMLLRYTDFSHVRRIMEHSLSFAINFRAYSDKGLIYYEMKAARVMDEDKLEAVIVGFADRDREIRTKKAYEENLRLAMQEAEAANEAKSRFLFNMSHDIRTPMNAVLGFTKLAEANLEDTEKVKDYLSKVETSGSYLLSLINDILDMARIESGEIELTEEPQDISKRIGEIATILQTQIDKKNIDFSVNLDIKHNRVYYDGLRIRQIVFNLLDNAIKYSKPGGKVIYDVKEVPSGNPELATYECHVIDEGIGISEEFREHIFDTFTRAQNSTASRIQGTGLGLAISKKLIEKIGGDISVSSEVGKGTDFKLVMTFKIVPDDFEEKENTPDELKDLSGHRVLLVEDNELNMEIAKEILEEEGLVVETAEDGVIALQMVQKSKPGYYEVILMDIQMPNMDGYEATRAIRRLPSKELSKIPVVAMTANAFEEDRQEAFRSGMNEHVAKPIDIPTLLRVLSKFI